MDTFEVGDMGEAIIESALKRRFKDVRTTPKRIKLQHTWSDFVIPGDRFGSRHMMIEVKTELSHTGNLFWERYSNRGNDIPGWGKTTTAHEIFYLFWKDAIGYRLTNVQNLKWLIDYYSNEFPLVEQKKHVQDNDSWGYLVPIKWFQSEDIHKFDFSDEKKARKLGD